MEWITRNHDSKTILLISDIKDCNGYWAELLGPCSNGKYAASIRVKTFSEGNKTIFNKYYSSIEEAKEKIVYILLEYIELGKSTTKDARPMSI